MTASSARNDDGRLLYRLPLTDGAVWLGLPLSALLVLSLTLAAAVGLVLAGGPLPVAVLLLLAAGLASLLPLAGRTLLGWSSPALRYLVHLLAGRQWTSTGCALPLPPECGRVTVDTFLSDPDELPRWAVLRRTSSRRRGRPGLVTLVFEVQHLDGVALLDPTGHDLRLAGWGACLDALSADPRIRSLQWLTHSRPDTRDPHTPWPATPSGDDTGPSTGSVTGNGLGSGLAGLRGDYDQLVRAAATQALQHQHLLAVTLEPQQHDDRTHRAQAASADSAGLVAVARDVATLLLTGDLLARPLLAAEVGTLLRRLTDPTLLDLPLLDAVASDDPDRTEVGERTGIRCRRSGWDHTRTDDSWHRSYTVTSWPRLPLTGDWLAALLQASPPPGTCRTVAVHVTPVDPVHAVRQARAAAAKAQLDAVDRGRFGLHAGSASGAVSAVDERSAQDAAELESELAAGFRLLRTRALVTVSAPDQTQLRQASTALRTAAATCRLDVRPLHGQHTHGLVATLPLGLLPGPQR
jgi:hypothetical protein